MIGMILLYMVLLLDLLNKSLSRKLNKNLLNNLLFKVPLNSNHHMSMLQILLMILMTTMLHMKEDLKFVILDLHTVLNTFQPRKVVERVLLNPVALLVAKESGRTLQLLSPEEQDVVYLSIMLKCHPSKLL